MTRILLADSNPTLRSALALLLETRLDVQIVGQVNSLESLLSETVAASPDIILMEWELSAGAVGSCLSALRQKAPCASILVTSARPENAFLAYGADAFLCKTDPPETILRIVQQVILAGAQKRNSPVID